MDPADRLDALLELDPRLHGYQLRAVQHLWENPRAALFMEMGLGKSFTVLAALTREHLPALVVGPKRVAEQVWPAETDKWRPDLTVEVATGTAVDRREALMRDADITTIGVDNLKDVRPRKYRTVVLDESSLFKNRATQRFKLARALTRDTPHVWELTGTPSPNSYLDLWAQVFLLDRGERLERGITHYRSRYFRPGPQLPNGVVTRWDLQDGAAERIEARISDICLSMRSEDYLELPPVTVNRVEVALPEGAARVYERLRRDLVADLRDDGGQVHTAANAAVLTAKLSQVTAGFLYPDVDAPGDTTHLHDEKIKAVREVVDGTGSPVLVFHRFTEERTRLTAALPEARQIDEPGAVRAWNAGEVPVLLAHPASAGHGLNLQDGGHTVVWTSPTWSSEHWQQANARVARQGQRHPVIVHTIVAPGTVDEVVLDRLERKVTVQDALLRVLG